MAGTNFVFALRDHAPADAAPSSVTIQNCADADTAAWLLLRWLATHCSVTMAVLVDPTSEAPMGGAGGTSPRTRLMNLFSRYVLTDAPASLVAAPVAEPTPASVPAPAPA